MSSSGRFSAMATAGRERRVFIKRGRERKELEKDERINLRVIFLRLLPFCRNNGRPSLPDAYFNYLNTALGWVFCRRSGKEIKWQKSTPVVCAHTLQIHTYTSSSCKKDSCILMKEMEKEKPIKYRNPFLNKFAYRKQRDASKTCKRGITINSVQYIWRLGRNPTTMCLFLMLKSIRCYLENVVRLDWLFCRVRRKIPMGLTSPLLPHFFTLSSSPFTCILNK